MFLKILEPSAFFVLLKEIIYAVVRFDKTFFVDGRGSSDYAVGQVMKEFGAAWPCRVVEVVYLDALGHAVLP